MFTLLQSDAGNHVARKDDVKYYSEAGLLDHKHLNTPVQTDFQNTLTPTVYSAQS